jgi:hypothetical protein
MQLIQMIWNGIGGLGTGTVVLKALFILVLGGVFWILCELVKYVINVFAKLAVDGLRYVAVVARGWPKEGVDVEDTREKPPLYRVKDR